MDYYDVWVLICDVFIKFVEKYYGFDFIVGGSFCNNFIGNNCYICIGFDGEYFIMFFEFFCIVVIVCEFMIKLGEYCWW